MRNSRRDDPVQKRWRTSIPEAEGRSYEPTAATTEVADTTGPRTGKCGRATAAESRRRRRHAEGERWTKSRRKHGGTGGHAHPQRNTRREAEAAAKEEGRSPGSEEA